MEERPRGGAGEVLVDRVRREISPNKIGARQWTEVMEAAHRLGMLHRDVTPNNVMLGVRGDPVLTDFGLARVAAIPAVVVVGHWWLTMAPLGGPVVPEV